MRSLRFRVAAAAFAAVAMILLLAGAVLVRGFEHSERSALDDRLRMRAGPAARAAPGVIPGGPGTGAGPGATGPGPDAGGPGPGQGPGAPEPGGGLSVPAPPPGLLRGSGDATRVIDDGQVVETLGDERAATLSVPTRDGFRTVDGPSGRWRTLAVSLPDRSNSRIETVSSLGPLDARVTRLTRRVALLGLAGLVGAGAAGWIFSGAALRSLERLRTGARGVSSTEDLSLRLPAGEGPDEVDELARTLNAMLERLEASNAETMRALQATREFAADAGHELRTPLTAIGANIETLSRNPGLAQEERTKVLEALGAEQERTTALLDALQALARGDAGAVMPRERIDLNELADAAVAAARVRHPKTEFSMSLPSTPLEIDGWEQGLRLAVDNLLDNAALHGRAEGRVELGAAAADGDGYKVWVDDDGGGVPAEERQRIFERFQRGSSARAPGSGLGLALVAQQAQLQGGRVEVGAAPSGGARFTLVLSG
jgi:two-component system, OmpR family, sensor histidine kinase PrrB